MQRSRVELGVGIFMILGLLALGYVSIKLGQIEILGGGGYTVVANFPSVGGLKVGSTVEIAGVQIGRVDKISLVNDEARVVLHINDGFQIQEDSIASIKTKGLIGEKYIRINPGGSEKVIKPDGRIREVEAPIDLEELLSKYIFGKV